MSQERSPKEMDLHKRAIEIRSLRTDVRNAERIEARVITSVSMLQLLLFMVFIGLVASGPVDGLIGLAVLIPIEWLAFRRWRQVDAHVKLLKRSLEEAMFDDFVDEVLPEAGADPQA